MSLLPDGYRSGTQVTNYLIMATLIMTKTNE